MKYLFAICIIISSSLIQAKDFKEMEFYGGVVKSWNYRIGAVCVREEVIEDKNVCTKFDIVEQNKKYDTIRVLRTIEPKILGAAEKYAIKDAAQRLNFAYDDYRGIVINALSDVWFGSSGGSFIILLLFLTSVAIDLAYFLVVLLTQGIHKTFDIARKRRLRKLIAHIFNSEKKGKTKRTRKRYYNVVERALTNYYLGLSI